MIKIGEFAKLFDVTVKTVRYYEEVGLLMPAYVDIYTGYRYFNEENIDRMNEILSLKDLGFSLDEIKKFSDEEIKNKIKDYKEKIKDLKRKLTTLKELSFKGKEALEMRFINDENAIGKWQLVGIAQNMESAKKEEFIPDDFRIRELYLMPNGKEYWVISWTKGIIKINGVEDPYEIIDDKMYVTINSNFDESKIAVYKKIDNKEYNSEDICIRDNIDLKFIEDKNIVGFWKSIDCIFNKNNFNPEIKQYPGELYLTDISVSPDAKVIINFSDGEIKKSSYTKGCIYNLCYDDTACKYELKTINGKEYMIIEWKSGDYVFGGFVVCYYVLEKMN